MPCRVWVSLYILTPILLVSDPFDVDAVRRDISQDGWIDAIFPNEPRPALDVSQSVSDVFLADCMYYIVGSTGLLIALSVGNASGLLSRVFSTLAISTHPWQRVALGPRIL